MAAERTVTLRPADRPLVRPALWWEVWALYRLHRVCFPQQSYGLGRFLGYLCNPRAVLLVSGTPGDLRGYCIVDTSVTLAPPEAVAEIISLGVRPPDRRQGLGRALLQAALAWAGRQGLAETWLQVAVSNHGAEQLYQEAGFERRDRLAAYYLSGEDAWLMRRCNTAAEREFGDVV
ncbi:MAG: GNAT family N-acetyltransferase [Fimbriimonadaceae bacterium]|nr:GNAT family N-acetyltransferase [Fimbriimonadaceae bacterium]